MGNFAVIQTGGKQYLVKVGDKIKVEKIEAKDGAKVSFDALLVGDEDGKTTKVGMPTVKGAKISAQVIGQGRSDKVTVVKYKPKVRYRRKAGHRQPFTELRIEEIKS
jgi:large subunit ribosomal protein L21